jgi:23S rRNA (uracil1939-C5)-methyltransferase
MTCDAKAKGCGGCPLNHLAYSEQLKKKQAFTKKHLSTFGKPRPILGMAEPDHYRNKAISTFAASKSGLISGIYREGTHKVTPVETCLLHALGTDDVLRAVRETVTEYGIAAYDEDRHTGFLRHVLVRRGHYTGQILVVLVTASAPFPKKDEFLSRLLGRCPNITSVVQNINARPTSAVLGFVEHVLYGPGYIEDTLCGLRFTISPRSFYQVNTVQTEVLYREAIRLAELTGKETVIDAYCGIGTLTLVAAKSSGQAIGIEINPAAVADANRNALANGMQNVSFLKGDAGRVMVQMAEEGKTADVVFMDPPRAGSSEEFLSALCALSPKRVVYISCNVETQARDLKYLHERGYKIRAIQPVDLFPHTEHVETVVRLDNIE